MVKGYLNVNLKVGDFVVYPGRQGSHIWLRYGIITDIGPLGVKITRGITYSTWDIQLDQIVESIPYQRTVTIKNSHLIVKTPFDQTEFANPSHKEYQLFQEIWKGLHIKKDIEDIEVSLDGC